MSESFLSVSLIARETTYATHLPSGERWGSRTSRKLYRSSTASGRFCASATQGTTRRYASASPRALLVIQHSPFPPSPRSGFGETFGIRHSAFGIRSPVFFHHRVEHIAAWPHCIQW